MNLHTPLDWTTILVTLTLLLAEEDFDSLSAIQSGYLSVGSLIARQSPKTHQGIFNSYLPQPTVLKA